MTDMRSMSTSEINDLQAGVFAGVLLLGYHEKGDTPSPITYYISTTNKIDDGGSVIVIDNIKLEHIFIGEFSYKYFGNFNAFLVSYYKNNHTVIIDGEIELFNGTFNIPDGCVLKFENGKFKNGNLTNCKDVVAEDKAFIFDNVIVDGLAIVNAEWFGLNENNENNSPYLTRAISHVTPLKHYHSYRRVNIGEGVFTFNTAVDVSSCMLVGTVPSQKLNNKSVKDYRTVFKYTGVGEFLFVLATNEPEYIHATFYMNNISIVGPGANTDSVGLHVKNASSIAVTDSEIQGFYKALQLEILISSKFTNTDLSNNYVAIYFRRNIKNTSTSTIFSNCYIFENDYHFKNDRSALINCIFDNCIFESCNIQSFLIDPGPFPRTTPSDVGNFEMFSSLSMINCYSENNNKSSQKKSAEIEILPFDGVQNFRLSTTNCMWFGYNANQGFSDFIKISSGAWFSNGDTFGRYNNVMEINDQEIGLGKINISFNSMSVDGFMGLISPLSIISEETQKYLYINSFSFERKRFHSIQPLLNISLSEDEYPDNGISIDRNIEKTKNVTVLKTQNGGFSRIDDNNVLSFGKKRKMGNTVNAISFPVNDSNFLIEKSSSEQGFIRFMRNKPGGSTKVVADFCLDYSVNGNESSDWWKSTTLLMVESTHDLPETPLPDIMYYKYGDEKFYFINAFTGKLVDGNGFPPAKSKGTTSQRPVPSPDFEGFEYYDKDLKKKILCNGISWVNVNGTPL